MKTIFNKFQAVAGTNKGCLLVAEMSSAGSLAKNEYTKGNNGLLNSYTLMFEASLLPVL